MRGWVSVYPREVVSDCLCITCFILFSFSLVPHIFSFSNNFYVNPKVFLLLLYLSFNFFTERVVSPREVVMAPSLSELKRPQDDCS